MNEKDIILMIESAFVSLVETEELFNLTIILFSLLTCVTDDEMKVTEKVVLE